MSGFESAPFRLRKAAMPCIMLQMSGPQDSVSVIFFLSQHMCEALVRTEIMFAVNSVKTSLCSLHSATRFTITCPKRADAVTKLGLPDAFLFGKNMFQVDYFAWWHKCVDLETRIMLPAAMFQCGLILLQNRQYAHWYDKDST